MRATGQMLGTDQPALEYMRLEIPARYLYGGVNVGDSYVTGNIRSLLQYTATSNSSYFVFFPKEVKPVTRDGCGTLLLTIRK